MSNPTVLVSGAGGQLGRRVLELLVAAPGARRIIATTRRPEALAAFAARGVEVRRADLDEPAGLAAAFAGADRALLISTDALDRPGRRLAQHRAAIAAFASAGVAHVVYTSALDAPSVGPITADHQGTEAELARSQLDHTILVREPLRVLAVVAIVVVGKSLTAYGVVRLLKQPAKTARTVAAALAQVGEFSFILVGLCVGKGLLPKEGQDLLLAGSLLSIALNPLVLRLAAGRAAASG